MSAWVEASGSGKCSETNEESCSIKVTQCRFNELACRLVVSKGTSSGFRYSSLVPVGYLTQNPVPVQDGYLTHNPVPVPVGYLTQNPVPVPVGYLTQNPVSPPPGTTLECVVELWLIEGLWVQLRDYSCDQNLYRRTRQQWSDPHKGQRDGACFLRPDVPLMTPDLPLSKSSQQ